MSEAFAGLQKLMLPDRWQALALAALRSGQDVIVDAPTGAGKTYIFERWDNFRTLARHWLREARADSLPDVPPLTADQRRPINHSVLRNPRPAPPGRAVVAGKAR